MPTLEVDLAELQGLRRRIRRLPEDAQGFESGLASSLPEAASRQLEDEKLHREVRNFSEEVLRDLPEQDIYLLAVARGRERSERERAKLTKAMREIV